MTVSAERGQIPSARSPLVAAEQALADILAALQSEQNAGVLVVAGAGLGKSALVIAVRQQLPHLGTLHVHGSPALSRVPYGALAPLLPELAPKAVASPMAIMRALRARLRTGPGEEDETAPASVPATEQGFEAKATPGAGAADDRVLVVVDDAQVLDEASAEILAQLADSKTIVLLVLSRSITDLPAAIRRQAERRQLQVVRLQPLDLPAVERLARQLLGAPVLLSTSAELARLSGGNPMFLQALVAHGLATGALVQRYGVWLLQKRILPAGGQLIDLIQGQFSALSRAERETLELVALAEPLPLSAAFSLGLHQEIDALVSARFLTVSADRERLLRPAHPLYGEAARQLVPAARSARLRQKVMAAMDTERPAFDALLRRVSWSLDCGVVVPATVLVAAATTANNLYDADFALRAAAAVDDPAWQVAADVQKARAAFHQGRIEAARALLANAAEGAADPATARMAILLEVQLVLYQGLPTGRLSAVAARWRTAIERLERSEDGRLQEAGRPMGATTAQLTSSRRGADLIDALALTWTGRHREAEEAVDRVLADSTGDGDDASRLLALALRGDILASTGRAESAVSYTSEALEITTAGNESLMIYWEFVLLRHVTALLRAGRFDEFQEAVRSYALTSPRSLVYFGGVLDFARGVLQLHNGRWDEAADSLTSALIAFRVHQVGGLIPLAAGMASLCAALTGSAGQEPAVPTRLPPDAGQLQLLGAGYATAASVVRNPGNQKELARLASLAGRAQDAGMLAVELELRLLSLRAGDVENLARVEQLSASMEGPVAAQAHAFAAASLAGDAATLLRLATADGPGGTFTLKQQCTAAAVRLAISSGDEELLQRARQLAAGPGPATLDRRTSKAQGLTRREQEIADLVAQGKRNADIATELSLSTRTVEGHIYRIFDKLGVRHRSELRLALRKQENRP